MTKRDLAKIGIERPEQMERRLPDGILISAKVALKRSDDGAEFNRVTRFDFVSIEPQEPEPFALSPNGSPVDDSTNADGFDWVNGERRKGGRPNEDPFLRHRLSVVGTTGAAAA